MHREIQIGRNEDNRKSRLDVNGYLIYSLLLVKKQTGNRHSYISYMANERLQEEKQFHSKNQTVAVNALAPSRIVTHSNVALFSIKSTLCETTSIFVARAIQNQAKYMLYSDHVRSRCTVFEIWFTSQLIVAVTTNVIKLTKAITSYI